MSEVATAARPVGILAKTARRFAVATSLIYVLSTPEGAVPFWEDRARMDGWLLLTFAAVLLAPWTALAAIVRQKEAFAHHQQLAFAFALARQ